MQAGHGVSAGRRGRRTFARTAIAAVLGTGSFMSMVHAQAPAPTGEQEDEREYRVAAGSLGVVLGQFAAAAGVVLSFDATLTAGVNYDLTYLPTPNNGAIGGKAGHTGVGGGGGVGGVGATQTIFIWFNYDTAAGSNGGKGGDATAATDLSSTTGIKCRIMMTANLNTCNVA